MPVEIVSNGAYLPRLESLWPLMLPVDIWLSALEFASAESFGLLLCVSNSMKTLLSSEDEFWRLVYLKFFYFDLSHTHQLLLAKRLRSNAVYATRDDEDNKEFLCK